MMRRGRELRFITFSCFKKKEKKSMDFNRKSMDFY